VHKDWHEPLKSVLVGCGRIAHSYATIIDNHPDMTLSAVVDVNPEAARAFGSSFGCRYYTSLADYLNSKDFADCGVVCTPPADHAEIACQLMRRGTSILCEMPFALNSESAEKMIEISETYGAHLMMGSKFRYIPDILHAKGLIQAGILGQILVFEIDFRDIVDMRGRWNVKSEMSGGGVLIDNGGHAIDITRHLFGPILRVRAEEARRFQSYEVEDTVRLDIRTVSGVIGTANLSWTIKNACDDYIRIYGTQGILCIGWKNSRYRPNGAMDWISFGEEYSSLKALTRQVEDLIDAVAGDGTPEISAEDGLESVRALEAAYRSLMTGQWVTLQPAVSEDTAVFRERRFSVLRPTKVSSNS
jgi:predicted dehydrogenase